MLAEFGINPVDGNHMSKDIAKVIQILDETGLDYRLGPMGTCVEGGFDEVMAAIGRCHRLLAKDHSRLITTVVIDDCRDHPCHLDEMVSHVEKQLGHVAKR